jgi:hypothetical protein
MQINNMREYYDKEFEAKDAQTKVKDQEIELLKKEIEELRSGKDPEEVRNTDDILRELREPPKVVSPVRNGSA